MSLPSLRMAKPRKSHLQSASVNMTQCHLLMSLQIDLQLQRRQRRNRRNRQRSEPLQQTMQMKVMRAKMRLPLGMKHLQIWTRTRRLSVHPLPLFDFIFLIYMTEKAIAGWTLAVYDHYHLPPSIKVDDGIVKYVFTCKWWVAISPRFLPELIMFI